MDWEVYILMADNGSLYTGIARNVERRFYEHLENRVKGAKFFRGNPPITLLFRESHENRSEASKREYFIKRLTRRQKESLIEVYQLKS